MLRSLIRQSKNATKYSLEGFKYLVSSEFAARIEVYCFLWIFPALIFLKLPSLFLLSALGLFLMLLATEALNTAIEVIVDKVSPEISDMAKHAKDLGSFAVMCLLITNIVHLGYALTKIDWSVMGVNLFIIASVLVLFLGVYLFVKSQPSKLVLFFTTLVLLIYVLGLGVYLASDYFTGSGFDHKVVYHLKIGLDGAGFAEYTNLILAMSVYTIVGLTLVYFMVDLMGPKKRNISQRINHLISREVNFRGSDKGTSKQPNKSHKFHHSWMGTLALCLAIILNPLTGNIKALAESMMPHNTDISGYDFYVKPGTIELKDKKNLVVLYLESFERTYFDTEVFPGLVTELSQLEEKSISFSDIRQVYNTEWTIAGLVATQCGVPMYTPSQGNTMNAYDQFVPNAVCLGDVLSENGYDLQFSGGSDLEFAGKGKFLLSHGFDVALGRKNHEANPEFEGRFNHWGLNDDALLETAYDDFISKSKKDEPFGLFLLTLGTHHPRGHLPPSCGTRIYSDGANPMLNAVSCADSMMAEFIQKVQDSPYAKDTLIVIVSDHIAMKNTAAPLLAKGERRNLFMIIDPADKTRKVIDRPASPLDVTPTILAMLGAENSAIGFGRDLFGPEKTLTEEKPERFNEYLRNVGKTMTAELWNFPKLSKGVIFDLENERLNIGRRWVSVPAMLILDKNNEIADLELFSKGVGKRKGYFAGKIPETAPYLWVDNCSELEPVAPSLSQISYTDDDWCANFGNNKEQIFEVVKLKNLDKLFDDKF